MSLMVVYLMVLSVGQVCAFSIGALADNISKSVGLFVFLALYFTAFVVCWKIAVHLTRPSSYIAARFYR